MLIDKQYIVMAYYIHSLFRYVYGGCISIWLEYHPVTVKVAGSSPVNPEIIFTLGLFYY